MSKTTDMDTLISTDLLVVPDDFSRHVMRQVSLLPMPERNEYLATDENSEPGQSNHGLLQWIAILGGSVLGGIQLLGFVFGIWSAMNAA